MKKIIMLSTIIIAIYLVGCSSTNLEQSSETIKISNSSNAENVEEIEKIPSYGSELVLSMRSPKTLNPLINQDVTVDEVLKLMFEPLFKIDEKSLKPVPNIASNYSISEDGMSIQISIRENIYWHDGNPITANDVVYSLDVIKQTPTSIYSNVLDKVASYSVSNNQVIINYTEPNGFLLFNLSFPIIPRHYYNGNLDVSSNASFNPVGSGSYKFASYRLANELVLESTMGLRGVPYITTIKAIITPDFETDVYAFENNVINAISTDFTVWGNLKTNRPKTVTQTLSNNFEFLGFNFENPIFADNQLRKAFAYAIPKQDIVNNVYLSSGIKGISPINPQSYLYTPLTETYSNSTIDALNALSMSNATSTSFSLLVNSENVQRLETANLIQKSLEQIGIEITIISKPFEQYKLDLENGDFELFLGGIDFDILPNFNSFLSSSGLGEYGINYQNYSNAHMDMLISNMYSATSEENFMSACADFQIYFSEELPVIGIMFKNKFLITDNIILGEKSPTILNPFDNIEKWYISTK